MRELIVMPTRCLPVENGHGDRLRTRGHLAIHDVAKRLAVAYQNGVAVISKTRFQPMASNSLPAIRAVRWSVGEGSSDQRAFSGPGGDGHSEAVFSGSHIGSGGRA